MKLSEVTICPALFSCYIAKKLKDGKRMSQERKELTDDEMHQVIVWYAQNRLEPNTQMQWEFEDGTKIQIRHINKNKEESHE